MTDTDTIKKNFSRFAEYYDSYAQIQNLSANKLIRQLTAQRYNSILDIGCGTGNYTSLLQNKFPFASITAMDISTRMIEVARQKLQKGNIDFVIADAETALLEDSFELITSNACFQWLGCLDTTLAKYKDLLTSNGAILFSMFGPSTYCELRQVLEYFDHSSAQISSAAFVGKDNLKEILEKQFGKVSITEQIYKKTYPSLWELLNTIKYTGTRGSGFNGNRITRPQLKKLQQVYKTKFKSITATYQIFYCRAEDTSEM
ncbi:malonyl-ACP O-methyltransferase BioC [Planctomycetota bacterium]